MSLPLTRILTHEPPASKSLKVDKKDTYGAKLCQLLDEYTQILIAAVDNVDLNQLQNIRQGLRELIKKGGKVGSSEAAFLAKLGIRPFSYGFVVLSGYDDGSVFSPK